MTDFAAFTLWCFGHLTFAFLMVAIVASDAMMVIERTLRRVWFVAAALVCAFNVGSRLVLVFPEEQVDILSTFSLKAADQGGYLLRIQDVLRILDVTFFFLLIKETKNILREPQLVSRWWAQTPD